MVHCRYLEHADPLLASRCSNGQKVLRLSLLGSMLIQRSSQIFEQQNKVGGLGCILGELPVDVDSIEAVILEQLHRAACELYALRRIASYRSKRLGEGVSIHGKHHFERRLGTLEASGGPVRRARGKDAERQLRSWYLTHGVFHIARPARHEKCLPILCYRRVEVRP